MRLATPEFRRRLDAAVGIYKSLARAVTDVADFDDLIADLRQVLFIYLVPKAPERVTECAPAETGSSPRIGGAA